MCTMYLCVCILTWYLWGSEKEPFELELVLRTKPRLSVRAASAFSQ